MYFGAGGMRYESRVNVRGWSKNLDVQKYLIVDYFSYWP